MIQLLTEIGRFNIVIITLMVPMAWLGTTLIATFKLHFTPMRRPVSQASCQPIRYSTND